MMRDMFRRGSSLPSFDGPDRPSARDEALATLEPWLAAHRRPAWRPTVEKGEPAGEQARSKFCGRPWLTAGEAPPACQECGRPLRLFVQLDLAELPAELAGRHGEGVLQFFYCAGGDGRPECSGDDGWVPFSDRVSLVRIVPTGELAPAESAGDVEPLPPSTIVGWERFDDVPDPEDHDLAGLAASYDFALRTVTLRCPEVGLDVTLGLDDLAVEDIARAAEGDKLGGWPSWIQGREYPACPTCGETMQLVLQLDSDDNVPHMWGDAGIGHITQCPTHLDVVAFGWACS
jgi:hypothetical protein